MEEYKSTILIGRDTRTLLTTIGRKNQTYDQVIRELIDTKNRVDSLEGKTKRLHSNELRHS